MAQPVAGANVDGRIRFALERLDSPRHRSHVAQLFFVRPILPRLIMKFADKKYATAEDERAQEILKSSDIIEVSEWLRKYPRGQFSSHSIDPDDPHGTPLAPVVARLTKAGAKRLVVHHGDGVFFVGLVVELPKDAKTRKKIFEVEPELSQICNQRVQKDYGQKYLYYSQ